MLQHRRLLKNVETKQKQSVFFETDEHDNYAELTGVRIRACESDEDYPMEITVMDGDGTTLGFALNRTDLRKLVAEAYSTGAV